MALDRLRVLAFLSCLGLLCGLFVLGGAGWPTEPAPEIGPDPAALDADYTAYIGQEIQTSGIVLEDKRVHVEPDETDVVVSLEPTDAQSLDLTPGEQIAFYGEIAAEQTILVESDHVSSRMPWERYYMYALSFVGAILTATYAITHWRFNRRDVVFEPRERPILFDTERDRNG